MQFEPDEVRQVELRRAIKDKAGERYIPMYKLIFCWQFWNIYLVSFSQLFYPIIMIISFKNYGLLYINDDNLLSYAGAFALLGNGLLRLVWPLVINYFTFKCANIALAVLQGLLIFSIPYSLERPYLYCAIVILSIMCEGGVTTTMPTVVLKVFGERRGPRVYSIMNALIGLTTVAWSLLI